MRRQRTSPGWAVEETGMCDRKIGRREAIGAISAATTPTGNPGSGYAASFQIGVAV